MRSIRFFALAFLIAFIYFCFSFSFTISFPFFIFRFCLFLPCICYACRIQHDDMAPSMLLTAWQRMMPASQFCGRGACASLVWKISTDRGCLGCRRVERTCAREERAHKPDLRSTYYCCLELYGYTHNIFLLPPVHSSRPSGYIVMQIARIAVQCFR